MKFTIALKHEADETRCREWLGRQFGDVKVTREANTGGIVSLKLVAEKSFLPPYREADLVFSAIPSSPCAGGVLNLTVTQTVLR